MFNPRFYSQPSFDDLFSSPYSRPAYSASPFAPPPAAVDYSPAFYPSAAAAYPHHYHHPYPRDPYDDHNRLTLLAARQEQLEQERLRKAQALAYLEEQQQEQQRRQQQLAFEHAIREEIERRRQFDEAAARRAALLRRLQEEEEEAQRQATIKREQERRRALAAEEEERRRRTVKPKQAQPPTSSSTRDQLPSDPASLLDLLFGLGAARRQASSPSPAPSAPTPTQQPSTSLPPSAAAPSFPAFSRAEGFPDPTVEYEEESDEEDEEMESEAEEETLSSVSRPPTPPAAVSPAPAPAQPSALDLSALEEAAAALQSRFRREEARRSALDTLDTLTSDFEASQSSFIPPSSLDFRPSASSPSGSDDSTTAVPPLAYSKNNAPLLGYEDSLVKLLSKIDEVQSGGDSVVKGARKVLVKRIEEELTKLDGLKEKAWEEKRQAGENQEKQQAEQKVEQDPSAEPSTSTTALPASTTADPSTSAASNPPSSTSTSAPPTAAASSHPAPLTYAAVAALPPHERHLHSIANRPRRHSHASTCSVATRTGAAGARNVNEDVAEVLKRAKELGERVEELERANAAAKGGKEEKEAEE